MKTATCLRSAGLLFLVVGASLTPSRAQDPELSLDRNRVMVAARFSFNITADLRNLRTPVPSPLQYDDGIVQSDISGNAGGKTWNWGYQNANQVTERGSLALHYTAGSPFDGTSASLNADLGAGFELAYGRELGHIRLSRNRSLTWGLQAGFGSLSINLHNDSTMAGMVDRVAHEYDLNGVVVPAAPYAGSFAGPGPLLSTNYTIVTTNLAATSSQEVKLESLVLGFKLGPFVEWPLYKRLSLQAGAGLAAVDVLTQLRWNESLVLADPSITTSPRTGDYDHSEWVLGYYANAALAYALNDSLSLFVGAQYQGLGDVSVAGGGKEATLHLGHDVEIIAGIRASF